MRKNKIFLFAAVVALVVGYAFFDFEKEKRDEKKTADEAIIFNLKPDQIKEFEIKGAEPLKLVRAAEGWKFEVPLQEMADQKAVNDFVDALVLEKTTAIAADSDKINFQTYGLDVPKGEIHVRDNAGAHVVLSVGTKKNFEGQSYLRRNQESKVLLGSGTWVSKVDKKPFDFRDRRLMQMSNQTVNGIQLKKGHEILSLLKKDEQWQLAEGASKKLDQNKVREIISMLNNSQATEFVTNLKPQGSLRYTLEISHSNGKKWIGQFYQGTDKLKTNTVLTSEPKFLMKIEPADADKFLNVTLDSLRDRKEPFTFNKNEVQRVELATPIKMMNLILKESVWSLESPDEKVELDSEKVKTTVQRISSLEIGQFKDVKTHPSLEKSQKIITLKNPEGAELIRLVVGDLVKEKNFTGYWVKASTYPFAFLVRATDVEDLKLESLVKLKEEKK